MVYKNSKEQGSKAPIDLRLGSTIECFGGLDLDKDAGAISDARFRKLINVRRTSGAYKERGGQVKSNLVSMGVIEGFIDTSDLGAAHPVPLGIMRLSDIAINPVYVITETDVGAKFYILDSTGPAAVHPTVLADGVSAYADFQADYALATPNGVYRLSDGGLICLPDLVEPAEPVVGYPLAAEDTNLYFMSQYQIQLWDGATVTVEHDFGVVAWGVTFAVFDGALFVGYHYNTPDWIGKNVLKKRTAPATFVNIAIPGVVYFDVQSWAEFDGRLYLIGIDRGDTNSVSLTPDTIYIISTDGATVTLDHEFITGGAGADPSGLGGIASCVLFTEEGKLYYLYWSSANGDGAIDILRVGHFDGDVTWTDVAKNLAADVGYLNGNPVPRGYSHGPNGFQIYFHNTATGAGELWSAPTPAGVTGTWVKVFDFSGNADFAGIAQFTHGRTGCLAPIL